MIGHLTKKELAKKYNVTVRTIARWVNYEECPVEKVPMFATKTPFKYWFNEAEVEKWRARRIALQKEN